MHDEQRLAPWSDRPLAHDVRADWRVFVVEDHPLAREGLRGMLAGIDGVEVVGDSAETQAVADEIRASRADLVLVDVTRPGRVGLLTTRSIKEQVPSVIVVVITAREDSDIVVDAFRAGAVGFLPRSADAADIADMLRSISVDGVYLRTADTSRLLRAMDTRSKSSEIVVLTPRERQVLAAIAQGKTAREIAEELGIGERTVHTYVGSMYRKLGVANKVGAVRAAIKLGLMDAHL